MAKPVKLLNKQILRRFVRLKLVNSHAKPLRSPLRPGRTSHMARQAATYKQKALQTTRVVNR
jgi:hypothetical protein